jgi:hypothetical protein
LPTPAQKNFKQAMNEINVNIENNKKEKFFSYIEDKYIASYYERLPKSRKRVRILNSFKYTFIIISILFCCIVYAAAPFSKFAAIPLTLLLDSIILALLGLVHPSLAFLDGKSRFKVLTIYTIISLVSLIFFVVTLISGSGQ